MLLHEDTAGISYVRDATPFYRREYHVQNYQFGSLLKYAQYIVQHDKWRNSVKHPHTKKQIALARREAARRKRMQIAHVMALFEHCQTRARHTSRRLPNHHPNPLKINSMNPHFYLH